MENEIVIVTLLHSHKQWNENRNQDAHDETTGDADWDNL